jgi:uncharacterized SAM-binding protein YcdF (DUF218 family)
MIWVTSTNYFAVQFTNFVGHWLDWSAPLAEENILLDLKKAAVTLNPQPKAIIILGGGRRKGALETPPGYQQQNLSANSMERLRYGARLARQTKLSILVTWGCS